MVRRSRGPQLVVQDAAGDPIYTIANTPPSPTTTSTTFPGGTTTTVTGGASTTMTLTPGTSTTTTTLPEVCAGGAAFASVRCRLAALLATVQGTADGPVAVKLVTRVAAAQEAIAGAEQLVTSSRKLASKRLARALTLRLASLRADLKTLRSAPGRAATTGADPVRVEDGRSFIPA